MPVNTGQSRHTSWAERAVTSSAGEVLATNCSMCKNRLATTEEGDEMARFFSSAVRLLTVQAVLTLLLSWRAVTAGGWVNWVFAALALSCTGVGIASTLWRFKRGLPV
jgi:hypothetical protein